MDKELSMRIAEAINNVASEYEMQIGLLGMVDLTVSVTEAVENYIAYDHCEVEPIEPACPEGLLDVNAYDDGRTLGLMAAQTNALIEIYDVDALASSMTRTEFGAASFALGIRHGMLAGDDNG